MKRACAEIEALIDRRVRGLAESERLVLEQHLSSCARCRDLSNMMRLVSDMVTEAPSQLSESARERAIAGALAAAARPSVRVPAPRRTLHYGIALAAAAALLVSVRSFWSSPPSAPMAQAPTHAHEPSRPELPSEPALWIEASAPEQRELAHAQVALARGTRARFHRDSRTLELAAGSVNVDVDVSAGKSFAVVTAHFRVEVLGTQFVVSPERVDVQRGHVQVLDLEGRVLARDLSSGASFSYAKPEPAQESPALAPAPEPAHGLSASQLLARAREALGRGDADSAEGLLARAARLELTRSQKAEAGTLRAECALIEHDERHAVAAYRKVAARYPELPAGENAAFAAAQISAREGRLSEARRLWKGYLARYPRGRFADEARARLSSAR